VGWSIGAHTKGRPPAAQAKRTNIIKAIVTNAP
jgi:hypothetical protein